MHSMYSKSKQLLMGIYIHQLCSRWTNCHATIEQCTLSKFKELWISPHRTMGGPPRYTIKWKVSVYKGVYTMVLFNLRIGGNANIYILLILKIKEPVNIDSLVEKK